MQQPGLTFLMNLTANGGISGAADASLLRADASDASAVNAFFTIHAGLAAGDKAGPLSAITENDPVEGFFHHFDAAGTGFDVNVAKEFFVKPAAGLAGDMPAAETIFARGHGLEVDPAKEFFVTLAAGSIDDTLAVETSFARGSDLDVNAAKELFVRPEIEGASETPAVATTSDQPDFMRKLRATDNNGAEIERINRLDIPNNSDDRRNSVRPEISVGVRVAKHTTPVIAQDARAEPDRGANRELPAFVDEGRRLGVFKNPDLGAGITIGPRELSAIPAAAGLRSIDSKTQNEPAFQSGQKPARVIGQQPAVSDVKQFDVAAFAASNRAHPRDIREFVGDITIRENASEIGASIKTGEAGAVTAPILNAGFTTQPGVAKLTSPLLGDAASSEVEGADIIIDETISVDKRFRLGSDAGRTAPALVLQAPTTMSALAASAVVAERITAEENFGAPVIEPGALSTTNSASERASIQFASPAAPAPAGAAWAQVISAISDRNGEAKLELRLNPPELGRVIISFESDGADLVRAVVSADSQQTLDLMRRNLDILQRELARSGLDDINVELADRDSNAHAQDANEQLLAYAAKEDAPAYINNNIPLAPFIAEGRLDLRV